MPGHRLEGSASEGRHRLQFGAGRASGPQVGPRARQQPERGPLPAESISHMGTALKRDPRSIPELADARHSREITEAQIRIRNTNMQNSTVMSCES